MTSQDLRDAAEFAVNALRQPQARPEDVADFLEKAVQDYDADRMNE